MFVFKNSCEPSFTPENRNAIVATRDRVESACGLEAVVDPFFNHRQPTEIRKTSLSPSASVTTTPTPTPTPTSTPTPTPTPTPAPPPAPTSLDLQFEIQFALQLGPVSYFFPLVNLKVFINTVIFFSELVCPFSFSYSTINLWYTFARRILSHFNEVVV
jgi:hypothetical protein